MPRRLQNLVVFAAPGLFVVLWATGFIGAKFGLPYAEPLTFLALRMGALVVLLGAILGLTRPKWPPARGVAHSAVTVVSAACSSPSGMGCRPEWSRW